jgi:hypothetical protein
MAQDATTPRDVLIAAGRQRLLTHGIEALRGLLNASALSRDVPVSRDTAYRVFRDEAADDSVADAVVMAVAEAAHELDWAGDNAAQAAAIEAYAANVNAGHDSATATKEVLRASYEAQFQSPGLAATWLLQAAALTASEAWQGDRPTEDGIDLCRRILALRRDYYRTGEDHVAGLFALAFSEIGRRPRSGIDPRTIVMLIHCLLDGAVLHRLLDPDSITPELAAEAMYLLGLAFTEVGLSVDARRPDDERALETFDRLIDAAATLWSIRPEISVEDAASTAETPMDAARSLFPTSVTWPTACCEAESSREASWTWARSPTRPGPGITCLLWPPSSAACVTWPTRSRMSSQRRGSTYPRDRKPSPTTSSRAKAAFWPSLRFSGPSSLPGTLSSSLHAGAPGGRRWSR